MKVKCIENKREFLPNDSLKEFCSCEEFWLIKGKEYTVYAITEFNEYASFCIWDENCYRYPRWYPSPLFEIANSKISCYWICDFRNNFQNKRILFFGFPEWINNPYFYDSLTDGEKKETEIFRKYRQLMEVEFPDRSIKERAEIGDEKWLMCPICIDAWEEPGSLNAMVMCPMCRKMMHNPRYKDELPHY